MRDSTVVFSDATMEAMDRVAKRGVDLQWTVVGSAEDAKAMEALADEKSKESVSVRWQRLKRRLRWDRLAHYFYLLLVLEQMLFLPLIVSFDSQIWPGTLGFWIVQIIFDSVFVFSFLWNVFIRYLVKYENVGRRSEYIGSTAFFADLLGAIPFYSMLFAVRETIANMRPPLTSNAFIATQFLEW
jgi:hypothetical protein